MEYWGRQDFDLEADSVIGNCVFCFMKGPQVLNQLSKMDDPWRQAGTPTDIGWWADLEAKYARTKPARDGVGVDSFNFQGMNKPTFGEIADGDYPIFKSGSYIKGQQQFQVPVDIVSGPVDISCECTD